MPRVDSAACSATAGARCTPHCQPPITLCFCLTTPCPQASPEEIKAQFRKLALATHPDKAAGGGNAAAFAAIRDAYKTLMDSDKRRAYDATLVQYLDMQVSMLEGRGGRCMVVACVEHAQPTREAAAPRLTGSSPPCSLPCCLQEFLNRYQELVLTVQGLSLPLRMPSLHPTTAHGPLRQPQQQPQRRCHAHTHPHAHGHHLRQLAARPPLLTWA